MFTRTCLLLMLSCFTVTAHAQIIGGNVNVLLGQRTMVDKAWEDAEVDNQIAVGLNVDLQLPLPVLPGIEFGFLTSEETGTMVLFPQK